MPQTTYRFLAAALLASACGLSTAQAGEITGSFTGTAINSYIGMYPNDPTDTHFDGTAITGTFDLIGTTASISSSNPSNYSAFLTSGETKLTFNLLGSSVAGTYAYDVKNPPIPITPAQLTANGPNQVITMFSQQIPGDDYTDSELVLAGSNLFDPANPLLLTPGTINYAASTTIGAFGERFEFGTGIQLTSVTFGTAPVPEPSSVLAVLSALLGIAAIRRR